MNHAGTVKWFHGFRGYGYIAQDDGPDIFVHFSQVGYRNGERYLRAGERVEYRIDEGARGPEALDVSVIEAVKHG